MQINETDNISLDIYNIRNITYIKLYDIVIAKTPKIVVVPSLLINYDGGKTLNLCSKDKYFTTYVKKVNEVYNDEKNNILEDSLSDPFKLHQSIEIDERTKQVLENGTLLELNKKYEFYEDKYSYDTNMVLPKDEFLNIYPIIAYHLENMFSNTDNKVNFKNKIDGYQTEYFTEVNVNGISKPVFITYDNLENNIYNIEIVGLIDNNIPVNMTIKFTNQSIDVDIIIEKYNLLNSYEYLITNGIVKVINIMKKNNNPINYINKDLDECQCESLNIINLDEELNLKYFKLPWNAYYGIDTRIIDLTDTEKNIEIKSVYLSIQKDAFIKKDFYSKIYKRNDTAEVKGETVILDEMIKETIGITLFNEENIYLIQTAFLDTIDRNGYYIEFLKNKYFYHLTESSNIKNIERDKLINIKEKDEVYNIGDVLNKELTKKLIGGK